MRLLEVRYPDKPARYFINGRRVSRDDWDYTNIIADKRGKRRDCFQTKSKDLGGGQFKRYNYSSIED